MAIDDASTALAPAASLTDPPVSTGAKRLFRSLGAGLARCIEHGDADGWRLRRRLARAFEPPAAILRA